jgi:hypothetical protein
MRLMDRVLLSGNEVAGADLASLANVSAVAHRASNSEHNLS